MVITPQFLQNMLKVMDILYVDHSIYIFNDIIFYCHNYRYWLAKKMETLTYEEMEDLIFYYEQWTGYYVSFPIKSREAIEVNLRVYCS